MGDEPKKTNAGVHFAERMLALVRQVAPCVTWEPTTSEGVVEEIRQQKSVEALRKALAEHHEDLQTLWNETREKSEPEWGPWAPACLNIDLWEQSPEHLWDGQIELEQLMLKLVDRCSRIEDKDLVRIGLAVTPTWGALGERDQKIIEIVAESGPLQTKEIAAEFPSHVTGRHLARYLARLVKVHVLSNDRRTGYRLVGAPEGCPDWIRGRAAPEGDPSN